MKNSEWPGLRIAAWIAFGMAGVSVVLGFSSNLMMFYGAALSCVFTGIAFMGADRALKILEQIRDAATPTAAAVSVATGNHDGDASAPNRPARSLAELAADLERLKTKS